MTVTTNQTPKGVTFYECYTKTYTIRVTNIPETLLRQIRADLKKRGIEIPYNGVNF